MTKKAFNKKKYLQHTMMEVDLKKIKKGKKKGENISNESTDR